MGQALHRGVERFTHVKVTDAVTTVNGYFTGTLDLGGGTTYTSLGGRDIIVAQFDQSGTVTWSKQIGTAGNDIPGDIALASDGSCTSEEAPPWGRRS